MMEINAIESTLMGRVERWAEAAPFQEIAAFDRQVASDPYTAVEQALDLSKRGRNLIGTLGHLTDDDLHEFLSILARVLQRGIVGFEELDVDGRPYKSFITTRAADPRLRGADFYRRPPEPRSRLDLLA